MSIIKSIYRFCLGQPLATSSSIHERLHNPAALAILASDALSSVAYAIQAIS